jgi:hypothetical protein
MELVFIDRFSKNAKIQHLMKIRPVKPSFFFFYSDGRTNMTTLIVSFWNFANTPTMVCLTKLPAVVTTQRLTVGGSVNNDLERIWKEAVTSAYLRKFRDICLAEENVGKVSVPGSEPGSWTRSRMTLNHLKLSVTCTASSTESHVRSSGGHSAQRRLPGVKTWNG